MLGCVHGELFELLLEMAPLHLTCAKSLVTRQRRPIAFVNCDHLKLVAFGIESLSNRSLVYGIQ